MMTLMLASVTGIEEAEIALSGGADVIDLKDPTKGALGALEPEMVRAAVKHIARRRPVSAVTGDLPMAPETIVAAATAQADAGVDYVKVGLFPDPRGADCIRALSPLAARTKIVGVMFADRGADPGLLADMAEAGFAGAMLDTADKGAGSLLDAMNMAALRRFVTECRARSLLAGLAGSLEAPDVPRLLLLSPDYLGFRGVLCAERDRVAAIDPEAVTVIRELIPADPRAAPRDGKAAPRVDYRLLAARGYSIDPKDATATDRVFVRDLVLPVRIGAYARERIKPQNVRFNVDVKVIRPGHAAEDMRDVFSYDVITDGISMIVAQEHIPLVETLAERIAAMLLADPRVFEVTVRVEKMEVGPGGVGIEITRERRAEVAEVHRLYPAAAGRPDKAAE